MINKHTDKPWIFNNDDDWFTTKETIQYFIENIKIDKNKTIWCPFDSNKSNFPKVLRELGYKVINSHIGMGQDFFTYEPDEHYDLIISNPPFHGKQKILQRLYELNKPFALIFGIQCFNSGGFTRYLGNFKDLTMIFLAKRFPFFKGESYDYKSLLKPTFHSMWICNKMETSKSILIWEGN